MAMETRLFGRTGVNVSNLCLGAMMFGMRTEPEESYAMVDRAIERGINFIDTANVYSRGRSETITGEALKRNGKRDRVVLATKFHGAMADDDPNMRGASRRHIIAACDASLKRLQTDYIDLYQMHRPRSDTVIDETLRALDDLIRNGKVRYIGTSTFAAWQFVESLWAAEKHGLNRFVCEQQPYNLLDRRVEPRTHADGTDLRCGHHPVESAGRRSAHRQIPSRRRSARRYAFLEHGAHERHAAATLQ